MSFHCYNSMVIVIATQNSGVIIALSTQTMHKSRVNHYKLLHLFFALFDSPNMCNLMTPEIVPLFCFQTLRQCPFQPSSGALAKKKVPSSWWSLACIPNSRGITAASYFSWKEILHISWDVQNPKKMWGYKIHYLLAIGKPDFSNHHRRFPSLLPSGNAKAISRMRMSSGNSSTVRTRLKHFSEVFSPQKMPMTEMHPPKTDSSHLKIGVALLPQKETIIFQPSIFKCYLVFGWCNMASKKFIDGFLWKFFGFSKACGIEANLGSIDDMMTKCREICRDGSNIWNPRNTTTALGQYLCWVSYIGCDIIQPLNPI